jgi:hypothetical protein
VSVRPLLTAAAVFALTGATLSSCVDPTQITVDITTDIDCKAVSGTQITVGRLGDLDGKRYPTAVTQSCKNGRIGSIVVVPSGGIEETVAIAVVAGVDGTDVETCRPPYAKGCIAARRSLRFSPHASLRVLVPLSRACDGVACPTTQTCRAGACVGATITSTGACAAPEGCGEDALAAR